jgi:cellulose 1,4-beta-cellobiosidase
MVESKQGDDMKSLVMGMMLLLATTMVAAQVSPSASLTWGQPTAGCGGGTNQTCTYNILRGTTSGGETPLASGVTTLSYTDTTVTAGSTYYYEVSATNGIGTGPVSNEVKAVIPVPPSAPTGLTVTTQ